MLRDFEVLFDVAEPAALAHPAYARYGGHGLGFPSPPPDRPWTYSNFVQSLDGIASLGGKQASGAHISQSREDRWLMDLLRAHADAVILGINTLVEETALGKPGSRGPIFRVEDEAARDLRGALGRGREMNIFVTGARSLDLSHYAIFDGERVAPVVLTTRAGAQRLAAQRDQAHVQVIVAGESEIVDLPAAMRLLRAELGIQHLLCEGGPTLYGYMARAGLIDEKFITLSPVEVGQIIPPEQDSGPGEAGPAPRLRPTAFGAPGFTRENAPWWRWMSCRKVGEHQFSRYRKSRT
jgi:5-amino-6-(5-phosphoribosylamino)uracil reductase